MDAEALRHLAWIALGSNIRPEHYLPRAVDLLRRCGRIEKVSRVWESAPVGFLNQSRFCNAAVQLRTALKPSDLRDELRRIEGELDRVRDPANKNAPRTIDLDIAIFDDISFSEGGWQVPDPEISRRSFVAVPLAELDGEYRHPMWSSSLSQQAAALGGSSSLTLRNDILPG